MRLPGVNILSHHTQDLSLHILAKSTCVESIEASLPLDNKHADKQP
jgi:hypothetical protein